MLAQFDDRHIVVTNADEDEPRFYRIAKLQVDHVTGRRSFIQGIAAGVSGGIAAVGYVLAGCSRPGVEGDASSTTDAERTNLPAENRTSGPFCTCNLACTCNLVSGGFHGGKRRAVEAKKAEPAAEKNAASHDKSGAAPSSRVEESDRH